MPEQRAEPRGEVVVYVGLGSNLDHPIGKLRSALTALGEIERIRLDRCSSFYRSAPVGEIQRQPDFINAVCRVRTELQAEELMHALLAIERNHGRVRGEQKGGPRALDLDLLLYGTEIIDAPGVSVPHPRLHERAFVLYPLLELEPTLSIPGRGAVRDWVTRCADQRLERLVEGERERVSSPGSL